jgi:hypothetical protein
MLLQRSATRWDVRRKVAIELLKSQIARYFRSLDETAKDKLKKAEATLAATQANLGKGLTALKG